MRLVLISDTHGMHGQLVIPNGDLLIHAGDLTGLGSLAEVVAFNAFLGSLPHRHKLVVAGNHDGCFEQTPARAEALLTNAIYLQDSAVELCGLLFYGSPWQPEFMAWAFNLPRGKALRQKWKLIPSGTDVLITHGPPAGVLDCTQAGEHAGCEELARAVRRVQPQLHVFGHVHEGYGVHRSAGTTFVNASNVNADYRVVNAPVVFDLAVERMGRVA